VCSSVYLFGVVNVNSADGKARATNPPDLIRFGPYEIDGQSGELRKFGVRLKLAGQPLQVLLLLVERAGELVTREELQQRLWPEDVYVDFERSLNSAVKKLRAALNDNPETPRYIETQPRKGYRFIGEIVKAVESQPVASLIPSEESTSLSANLTGNLPETPVPAVSHSVRWLWAGVAAIILVGGWSLFVLQRTPKNPPPARAIERPNVRASIAILGFKNLSSEHNGDWLGTAIVQMLSTELETGGKLRIVAEEAVAKAKANLNLKEKDGYSRDVLRQLHDTLGSDYIVAGSYVALGSRESGQVRLDLRLQEAISGETLASIAVNGKQSEIFDLVGRAGQEMRAKAGGTMGPEGDADWRAALPSSPEAARLYSDALNRMRLGNNLSATDRLQQCLALEPGFALGHAALAEAWQALGYDARAQASAQKALTLAALLPENVRLKVEGQYYESQHDWAGAIPAYRHLLQDYPDDLESGLKLAVTEVYAGSLSDAASTVSTLRSQQPTLPQDARIDLVEALLASRTSDYKTELQLARSAEKKANSSGARLLVARAKLLEGWALDDQAQLDEALQAYRSAQPVFEAASDTDNAATVLDDIGIVLEKKGDLKGAQDSLQEAEKRFRQIGDLNGLGAALTNLGELYHAEGDLGGASDLYSEALDIFRKTSRKENEYATINNLGGVQFERGDFRAAKKSFETLLQFKQSSGDKNEIGYAKLNLAGVLWVEGQLDRSANLLEEALRTFRETGDRSAISSVDTAYSKVLALKKDFPAARRALSDALALDRAIGNKADVALDSIQLAQVSLWERHPDQVDTATLQSSVDELRKENRKAGEVEGLIVQIRALLAKRKVDDAKLLLVRAEAVDHTTWLANYELMLADAEIDAAAGNIAPSRHKIEVARSEAEKVGCRACELEFTTAFSDLKTQSSAKVQTPDLSYSSRPE
jgi:DNA-binding winged helix-turn-helix (wHTH) protein/tetratricopeptide (TPR) repeat protein